MFFAFMETLAALAPEIAATEATLPALVEAGSTAAETLGTVGSLDAATAVGNALAAGAPEAVAGLEGTAATALGGYGGATAAPGILGAEAAPAAATASTAAPAAATAAETYVPGGAYTPDMLTRTPPQWAGEAGAKMGEAATTASDGILGKYLPSQVAQTLDPIAKGVKDAYGIFHDATKGIGGFMKENPLESALLMSSAQKIGKNLFGNDGQVDKKIVKNPHPLSGDYQPARVQSDQNVFQPMYQSRVGYAQGGIAALADGNQSMGGNQAYPQGLQDHTQYATPSQMPTSAEVVNSGYEMKTDPYMGTPTGFASGGILAFSAGTPNPNTDMYARYMEAMRGKPQEQDISYLGKQSAWNTNKDNDANTALLAPHDAAAYRLKKLQSLVGYANRAKPEATMALGAVDNVPAALRAQQAAAAAQAGQAAQQPQGMAPEQDFAKGGGIMGASTLGGYAAGGNPRLLKGPGDGMSDNIPAVIGNKQPARLADGEFVIPADVVSHLGNGSTEAGAKHLHDMMDKVRKARTGNKKQGKQIDPNRFLPA